MQHGSPLPALPGFQGRGCLGGDPGPGPRGAAPAPAGRRPPSIPRLEPAPAFPRNTLSEGERGIKIQRGGGGRQSLAEVGD